MLCRPSQSPPLFSSWHNPRMNGIHYERRKGECGISSITRRLLALLTAAAVLWAAGGCRQGENPADVSPETSLSGESRPEDSSTGDASPGGEASGGSVPDDSAAGSSPSESRLPDGSSPGGPSSGNPSSGIPSSDDPASSTPSPDNPASQITLEILNNGVGTGGAALRARTGVKHQTVRSFGVSGAWWSTGIGDRSTMDEILALLFTDRGIALNTYRQNIGGGRAEGPLNDSGTGPDPWRAVPCPLKADGSIDITADAKGWMVLQKIMALGTVEDVVLFMNSPPAGMTVNGRTYNPASGSNLRPECYNQYAAYCADVTKAYLEAGIPVRYISPINEPQWQWNDGWQEGCHYAPEEALRLTRLVVAELNRRRLPVKISVNESAEYRDNRYTYQFYESLLSDSTIYPYIDHFAVHGYSADAQIRSDLYAWTRSAAGRLGKTALPVYQSEYAAWKADTNLSAAERLTMTARALHEDLTLMNVSSWDYFAAVARGADALIVVNDNRPEYYALTRHFWAIGNYSKFIKGYTRVEVEGAGLPEGVMGSAYLAPDGKELVFVAVNDTAADKTVALAGLPAGSRGEVYETSMQRTCETARGIMLADNGYVLPAESVTTFVFQL